MARTAGIQAIQLLRASPRAAVSTAWTRPLVSWHAIFPVHPFGPRVSHQIPRHLLSSLPATRAMTLRLAAKSQRPPTAPITASVAARKAVLDHPPERSSGRYDETGSAASSTSTSRSHDMTGFSAPTAHRHRADHTQRTCLWYGSFRSRTVRVILVRDDKPRTRGRDDRGYGLPSVTTDLESSAEDLVARHADGGASSRPSPRPPDHRCGRGANPTCLPLERTVPFGLICFSVVTV